MMYPPAWQFIVQSGIVSYSKILVLSTNSCLVRFCNSTIPLVTFKPLPQQQQQQQQEVC